MDTLNEQEKEIMVQIANTNDYPVLMMNFNRYKQGIFPDSPLYQEWRKINAEMISNVGGRILWSLPVMGQILTNGPIEPIDEILAYWYPSHQSFLNIPKFEVTISNFEIRKEIVEFAVVNRCDGSNPPVLNN